MKALMMEMISHSGAKINKIFDTPLFFILFFFRARVSFLSCISRLRG
jgi:hypothetical protein